MNSVLPRAVASALNPLEDFSAEGHRKWFDLCYKFFAWEREQILLGKPDAATKSEHKKALLYLLKVTEVMTNVELSDVSGLETLRWRLNESWQLHYNQPDAEKTAANDAFLAGLFPE